MVIFHFGHVSPWMKMELTVKDISVTWLFTFISGVGMWLLYGYLLGSIPIIFANGATLVLVTLILVMKLKNRA